MDELESLYTPLEFLEIIQKKICKGHEENYHKCIANKKNSFESCYILHMEKFHNCAKSALELKKMKKE